MQTSRIIHESLFHYIIIIFLTLSLGCLNENQISTLYLQTDQMTYHNKSPMQLYASTQQNNIQGTIKNRGGFSSRFPKKSYELNLEKDISLAQLPKDDDWILNANFIDKTFLRHILSYELFQNMNKNNVSSKSKHVELFINNEYQGLYVLMEKLDKSSLGIKAQDSLSFIFKDPHLFRESYSNITPQKPYNFHQQTFPKISKSDNNKLMDDIRDFILNCSNEVFSDSISKIFDLENIIDWHLLLLITNNSDGLLKNFYLYKQSNTSLIRISPWDYDHSFGRDGDNELHLYSTKINIHRSILFARLLKHNWYKIRLKTKWDKLNKTSILTREGLKLKISKKYEEFHELIEKNNQLWCNDSHYYHDHNNIEQEIQIMYRFIEERHAELELYFNEMITHH